MEGKPQVSVKNRVAEIEGKPVTTGNNGAAATPAAAPATDPATNGAPATAATAPATNGNKPAAATNGNKPAPATNGNKPAAAANEAPATPTSKKGEFIKANNGLPKELKDAVNTLYWLFNTFGVEEDVIFMILEKWLEKKKKSPKDAVEEVKMFTRGLQIQPPTEGLLPHLFFAGKDSRNIFNSAGAAAPSAPAGAAAPITRVNTAKGGARRRIIHSTRRQRQTSRRGQTSRRRQTRHLKQMNKRR